jgi:hypothetical protein
MRAKTIFWILNGVLIVAAGVLLLWRGTRTGILHQELKSARSAAQMSAALAAKNRELSSEQPPAEELQRLRADHEKLSQLRVELSRLKKGADDRIESAKRTPKGQPTKGIWPDAGPELTSQAWKNAGRSTPAASFETTLWAAANGEVDILAAGLLLSKADGIRALLAELPLEARTQYSTPENLIATLMAKDVTARSIQILEQAQSDNPDSANLTVRLNGNDGTDRQVMFNAYRLPDGWKIVVPKVALDNYLNQVRGSASLK